MVRTLLLLLLGSLLLVIQCILAQTLPAWMGKPDLLFILVIFIAIDVDFFSGAILVFAFGLLMDIFSGIYLGMYPLLFLLIFFSLKLAGRQLILTETSHIPAIIVTCYFLLSGSFYILSTPLVPDTQLNWQWREIFLQALILVVISIPLRHMFIRFITFFSKGNSTSIGSLKPQSRHRFTT